MIAPIVLLTHIATAVSAASAGTNHVPLVGTYVPPSQYQHVAFEARQERGLDRIVPGPAQTGSAVVTKTAPEADIKTAVSATTAVDQALARLRRFRNWGENWDGEGAPAPSPVSIDRGLDLLALLARGRPTFSVGLDADARPMFNLRESPFDGHVAVEVDGALSFFFVRDGGEVLDGYGLAFDGRQLPADLKEALLLL